MPTTISAGTYNTKICYECPDGSGGTIATAVDAPHPTYTDGQNNSIIQLDMVALGGPNGLNS
jgi:hypothetical protein